MLYTIPHYYKKFQCIAGECPDTCCAGWQIVIDDRTREKYRRAEGAFGNRLHNSIDWKESCFQQYEGRCAFLNDENLCDIYQEKKCCAEPVGIIRAISRSLRAAGRFPCLCPVRRRRG